MNRRACRQAAAAVYLADMRLPSVQAHAYVVLAAPAGEALHLQELVRLKATSAPPLKELAHEDAFSASLTASGADVVGIFAILPSSPSAAPPHAWTTVRAWLAKLREWMLRLVWAASMLRFGWRTPVLALVWMAGLRAAAAKVSGAAVSRGYDHLQVMCVAKAFQGRGLGTRMMQEVFRIAREKGVEGLAGLCQSEQTQRFYGKCGFLCAEVLQHAHGWRGPGSARSEYHVTWRNDSSGPSKST